MNMFRKSSSRSNSGVSTVPKLYASVGDDVTDLIGVYGSKMFRSTVSKFGAVVMSSQQEVFNHPITLVRQAKLQKFVMTFEDKQQTVFDDGDIFRHCLGTDSFYVCTRPMVVLLDTGEAIHRVLACYGWHDTKGYGAIFNFYVKNLPDGFELEMLTSKEVQAYNFYEEQKLIEKHGEDEAQQIIVKKNVESLISHIMQEVAKFKSDGGQYDPDVEAMIEHVPEIDDEGTLDKLYNTVLVARAKFQEQLISKLLTESKGRDWVKEKTKEIGVVSNKWAWLGREAISEGETKRFKEESKELAKALEDVKHLRIAKEAERKKASEKLREEREGTTVWFGGIN